MPDHIGDLVGMPDGSIHVRIGPPLPRARPLAEVEYPHGTLVDWLAPDGLHHRMRISGDAIKGIHLGLPGADPDVYYVRVVKPEDWDRRDKVEVDIVWVPEMVCWIAPEGAEEDR